MPNTKSAARQLRTGAERRTRNRKLKERIKNTKKQILASIEAKNPDEAETGMRELCSALDKAVKRGTIAENKASRDKSRLAARISALRSSAAS